jgi:hypothetical protein
MLLLYNKCLVKYSLFTNCVTALFVYSAGDIAAQYIEKRNADHTVIVVSERGHVLPSAPAPALVTSLSFVDWARTQEMLVWSAGIYTPLFVVLYKQMDVVWPTSNIRHICMKIAASSVANIPTLCLFFSFGVVYPQVKLRVMSDATSSRDRDNDSDIPQSTLDWHQMRHDCARRIRLDLMPTLTAGFAYWWPVNALIFRFVPSLLRPVGMSVGSVLWGCYLSMVQFKKPPAHAATDAPPADAPA